MVATNFNAESGHNSLPWASVLGAGGAVLVAFVEVRAGDVVVLAGAVLAGVVFGGVPFAGVVVAAVVLGPVVFTGAVAAVVGMAAGEAVVGAGLAAAEPVLLEGADAVAPVEATLGELEGNPAELPASTPVSVGVDELLTSAASPALPLPAAALERPAIRKTRPISTTMAAAIRKTRRSQ